MTDPKTHEQLIRWLIGLGSLVTGVVGTVAGSWISSRIHVYDENRRVHLEALRDSVLKPLRAGLQNHLRPVLTREVPVVRVVPDARTFHPHAKVTENPESLAILLAADFPFSGIYEAIEPGLLYDAQAHHYAELMRTIELFVKDCIDYARDCQAWISGMAVQLPGACDLPPFTPNQPGPYVMNCRLAHFVYLRLFQFRSGVLQKQEGDGGWTLAFGSYTAAAGSSEQVDALIQLLNEMIESEKPYATRLQTREMLLRERFTRISQELDFAVASRHLHGRCDLVPFP